jgi:hypothetical protein
MTSYGIEGYDARDNEVNKIIAERSANRPLADALVRGDSQIQRLTGNATLLNAQCNITTTIA